MLPMEMISASGVERRRLPPKLGADAAAPLGCLTERTWARSRITCWHSGLIIGRTTLITDLGHPRKIESPSDGRKSVGLAVVFGAAT
jgi:hypothetical protein